MIQINLLPPEMRVAARGSAVQLPWRRIGLRVAGLAMLISVVLPLNNGLRAHRLERLRGEWKALQPQREKLTQVQNSLQSLTRQAEVLRGVKAPQAKWSPRLALLADALVPQVWLTHLEYAQEKNLRVKGSALVGLAGDGSGQVTQFMQHLKERPEFHQWFDNVELESVQHRQIQNEEIVDFVLLLTPTG